MLEEGQVTRVSHADKKPRAYPAPARRCRSGRPPAMATPMSREPPTSRAVICDVRRTRPGTDAWLIGGPPSPARSLSLHDLDSSRRPPERLANSFVARSLGRVELGSHDFDPEMKEAVVRHARLRTRGETGTACGTASQLVGTENMPHQPWRSPAKARTPVARTVTGLYGCPSFQAHVFCR